MALRSADDLAARLVAAAGTLQGKEARKRLAAVGVKLRPVAEAAAAADLGGDAAFSGWRRGSPIRLGVRFQADDQTLTVMPAGRARGPWRVAEQGRNQGNARGFAGPGVNRRTGRTTRTASGGVRVRPTRQRRWNGRTAGKQTWSDAEAAMERVGPRLLREASRGAVLAAMKGRRP